MTGLYRVLGSYRRPIGARRSGGRLVATGESIHRSAMELVESSGRYRTGESGRALMRAVSDGVPLCDAKVVDA